MRKKIKKEKKREREQKKRIKESNKKYESKREKKINLCISYFFALMLLNLAPWCVGPGHTRSFSSTSQCQSLSLTGHGKPDGGMEGWDLHSPEAGSVLGLTLNVSVLSCSPFPHGTGLCRGIQVLTMVSNEF